MHVTPGHAYRESAQALSITDKRGQHLQSTEGSSNCLPISELGSKAIYQVCAGQFMAAALAK
jgi:hypothetical protein